MANYSTHLAGGIVIGVVGGLSSIWFEITDILPSLGVMVAGIAGGLAPDVDHDSSRPSKILFSWGSLLIPTLMTFRIPALSATPRLTVISWICLAFLIYFPARHLFMRITKHRGIFHSVPAIFIFGGLIYLWLGRWVNMVGFQVAAGVTAAAGYLTHLVLDEIWAVDFNGVRLKKKRSFGSALAFAKPNKLNTLMAYLCMIIVIGFSYLDYVGHRPEKIIKTRSFKSPTPRLWKPQK